MNDQRTNNVVVMLTTGKADNGKNATLAFSCGLSSLAMQHDTSVFLTSDGAVWGFKGSADGIIVQGFPPLSELIEQYTTEGGRIILCSICHRTCSSGSPDASVQAESLPHTEMGGFATMLDLAMDGIIVPF